MHYMLIIGANVFYKSRRRNSTLSVLVDGKSYDIPYAFSQKDIK
ncbi:MAG: Cell wall hydrolase [Candidatus Tokpelaia sp. JSC189]|nr:MAG: Cell wall hydrolase [Candidatus Tokpelaia sp. JSC189]